MGSVSDPELELSAVETSSPVEVDMIQTQDMFYLEFRVEESIYLERKLSKILILRSQVPYSATVKLIN